MEAPTPCHPSLPPLRTSEGRPPHPDSPRPLAVDPLQHQRWQGTPGIPRSDQSVLRAVRGGTRSRMTPVITFCPRPSGSPVTTTKSLLSYHVHPASLARIATVVTLNISYIVVHERPHLDASLQWYINWIKKKQEKQSISAGMSD